ncbi:MAG: FAD-dependent oxidoreductase [Anaeroplasma sp.]
MNDFFWFDKNTEYSPLTYDIEVEALVIGGGICGILCAYQLAIRRINVILVDKGRIGEKRTAKTTATITALQDFNYYDLIRKIGKEKARLVLEANLNAIEEYEQLSKIYDFDFERVSSYKYTNDSVEYLFKELNSIADLGYKAFYCNNISNLHKINGAIEFKNQAQMNPLKLIASLKNYFTIYENTEIINIKNNVAYTSENNKITAKNIIICTGYPFMKLKGKYFLKLIQEKSYVIAFKTNKKINGNAIGINKDDLYFRNYKEYMIIGGSQEKVSDNKQGYEEIEDYISANYGNVEMIKWVNQDTISLDSLPYIGRYSNYKNVYVATGFNLWGMTAAMISSLLIRDLILDQYNVYEKIYNPKRKIEKKALINNISNASIGMLTPSINRCTHLGCALSYNEKEGIYECKCHGSKFDKDGNIIIGPAQKNFKK